MNVTDHLPSGVTPSTTQAVLHRLRQITIDQHADQLWLFGSAVKRNYRKRPGDIDIAVLTSDSTTQSALLTQLTKVFPEYYCSMAGDYYNPKLRSIDRPAFHIVVGKTSGTPDDHPIYKSIRSGCQLWGADPD